MPFLNEGTLEVNTYSKNQKKYPFLNTFNLSSGSMINKNMISLDLNDYLAIGGSGKDTYGNPQIYKLINKNTISIAQPRKDGSPNVEIFKGSTLQNDRFINVGNDGIIQVGGLLCGSGKIIGRGPQTKIVSGGAINPGPCDSTGGTEFAGDLELHKKSTTHIQIGGKQDANRHTERSLYDFF